MEYWIFKVNPSLYRIDYRLKDPDPKTTWQVKQHLRDKKAGDFAFIWRAADDFRGICAIRANIGGKLWQNLIF